MVPSSKWISQGMAFVVTVCEEWVHAVYVNAGGRVDVEDG